MTQPITDGLSQPAAAAEPVQVPVLPSLKLSDQRRALSLAHGKALLRRAATNACLNGVERGNAQQRLSGDGRLLASLVERGGRTTVLLQDRRSGQVLPLRHLRRQQPHSSPSLSWTGRYMAVLVQQGPHRQAVIEDRASGRLQPLFLPSGREPQRLSLAPDGRRLAMELLDNGQRRVELFDLSALLEPDLAPGQLQSGGGPGVAP